MTAVDEGKGKIMEDQFIQELRNSQTEHAGDNEAMHRAGEEVILRLLRAAGYEWFAAEYEKASENWWYA